MKELPNVFASPINKEIKNNTDFFYGKLEKENLRSPREITKIVNNIFERKDFVYKKKVKITTFDDTFETTLVGRNNTNLLTLDRQAIPIISITDIEVLS